MAIRSVITQLRTTDLDAAIDFYTTKLGLALEFRYEDFYAGIRAGDDVFHLKLADRTDSSIEEVAANEHFHLYFETDDAAALAMEVEKRGVVIVRPIHETAWGTKEFVVRDDDGHTLYFAQR